LKEVKNIALSVYINKGNNFMKAEQYENAKEMYQLAYKRAKSNVQYNNITNGHIELNMGKLYAVLKEEENCREFLIKALKKDPNLIADIKESHLFDNVRDKDWFKGLITNI
jgi:tetratricopeptide (TPR) repeat protein